jgi:hypothetical protein
MTPSEHRRAHGDWTREIIELAALFLVAGAANLLVTGVRSHSATTLVLMSLGVVVAPRNRPHHDRGGPGTGPV